jgi:adenylate cyclase class 2
MSEGYQETELKVWVADLAPVHQALEQAGATVIQPRSFEKNIRYEDAAESLTARGIVVRLRQDQQVHFTYKEPGFVQDGIVSRFEAEVQVSDFETMEILLTKLGYHPFMQYEKYRTTYALDGVEVMLDELPYGFFVEIEGTVERIQALATRLNLADAPRYAASYVHLFDNVRRFLGLSFRDLSFENFAGIQVPQEALIDHG